MPEIRQRKGITTIRLYRQEALAMGCARLACETIGKFDPDAETARKAIKVVLAKYAKPSEEPPPQ